MPGDWTFVVVTDRTELDDQIYKNFVSTGLPAEKREAVEDWLLEVPSDIENLHDRAFSEAQRVSEQYACKARARREREIAIRRDDAERYSAVRIGEQQRRVVEYQRRLDEGEDMEIAIRGVESEICNLEQERERTLQHLKEDEVIVEEAPELLNVAVVLPLEDAEHGPAPIA